MKTLPLAVFFVWILSIAKPVAFTALAADAQPRERTVSEPAATAPRQGGDLGVKKEEKSVYDRLWALPVIYKDDDSDVLNEFRFIGRFHGDAFNLDSNLGNDSDWVVRRLRFGAKARLFHHLDLSVEADFDPQKEDPVYRRLTDAYLAWTFHDAFKLTLGKQGARFTLDGSTSSNELLTIERSSVANNLWFTNEYMPGVTLSGKSNAWVYNVGVFSGGSASPEFGNFDGGNFGLATIGYDFAKRLEVKKALFRADYVYNDVDAESTFIRPLEQIGALVFVFDTGNWGFSTDVAAALGGDSQSDLFGTSVMPWLNLTPQFQIVARYAFVASEDDNGVRFNRYESFQTGARGDENHEFYAGLNYYLYGHKLKVQTGVTYVAMNDAADDGGEYEGWAWTAAVRFSF